MPAGAAGEVPAGREGSTEALPEEAGTAGTAPAPEAAPPADAVAPEVEEEDAASAREAAILYAYEVVDELAGGEERVELLAIGDVQAQMAAGSAQVAVPLEISRHPRGHVPHKERALLQVRLARGAGAWEPTGHEWGVRAFWGEVKREA